MSIKIDIDGVIDIFILQKVEHFIITTQGYYYKQLCII